MSTHTAIHDAVTDTDTSDADGVMSAARREWRLPLTMRRARLIPVANLVDPEKFAAYLDTAIRSISSHYSAVDISTASVPLSTLRPLSYVAEKQRYKQAKRLVRLMRRRRLRLFEPCLVQYPGEDAFRLVIPPVAEKTSRGLVVIDGVHRLTAVFRSWHRDENVSIVVITGTTLPRPASRPVSLDSIEITNGDRPRAKKFKRLRPKLFRPAGSTLRSSRFRFESTSSFIDACDDATHWSK
jgi:hypothetical protein